MYVDVPNNLSTKKFIFRESDVYTRFIDNLQQIVW